MAPPPLPSRRVQIDGVLPPPAGFASHPKNAHAIGVARIIAYWMDEFIRIPGTRIRVGLDPFLGLIPGFGAFISSGVSLVVLAEAVRLRVPLSVLGHMGVNIVINQTLDSIPLVGDTASIFFRSNSKNLALIERWRAGEQAAVKRGSRVVLALFVGFWAAVILVLFLLILEVLHIAWQVINGTA